MKLGPHFYSLLICFTTAISPVSQAAQEPKGLRLLEQNPVLNPGSVSSFSKTPQGLSFILKGKSARSISRPLQTPQGSSPYKMSPPKTIQGYLEESNIGWYLDFQNREKLYQQIINNIDAIKVYIMNKNPISKEILANLSLDQQYRYIVHFLREGDYAWHNHLISFDIAQFQTSLAQLLEYGIKAAEKRQGEVTTDEFVEAERKWFNAGLINPQSKLEQKRTAKTPQSKKDAYIDYYLVRSTIGHYMPWQERQKLYNEIIEKFDYIKENVGKENKTVREVLSNLSPDQEYRYIIRFLEQGERLFHERFGKIEEVSKGKISRYLKPITLNLLLQLGKLAARDRISRRKSFEARERMSKGTFNEMLKHDNSVDLEIRWFESGLSPEKFFQKVIVESNGPNSSPGMPTQ